ncbi:MAG TPA: MBL fold hydrolase [Bacteroidales bacterium]|nr:MBL fold hydrolase [Bacteroidales bacterium]
MIKLKQFAFNPLQVNLYLLYEEGGSGILIDPSALEASELARLDGFVKEHSISLELVLATHGHFDHLFGAGSIRDRYHTRFMIHPADAALANIAPQQASVFGLRFTTPVPEPEGFLEDGQEIRAGSIVLRVIHVPGHSPGCVAFYEATQGWLFAGDTLFSGSIGRTDLPGGDFDQIIESIRTRLFLLPDETRVFPGHGLASSIGKEKLTNPYVGG